VSNNYVQYKLVTILLCLFSYYSLILYILISNSAPHPHTKNTPTGGNKNVNKITQQSITIFLKYVELTKEKEEVKLNKKKENVHEFKQKSLF
jgi:hypothetical protein